MYNREKRLLIIGNGSIGIENNERFYINNHTGDFLSELNKKVIITFMQSGTIYDQNNNLHNFDLKSNGLSFKIAKNKKEIGFFPSLLSSIWKNDFVYVFYPGTLGKLTALLCFFMKKKYGFYIRGQFFNQGIIDRLILKNSQFCLTVSPSIKIDLQRFTQNVSVIKPMIDVNMNDLNYTRDYRMPKVLKFLFVGRVEYRKGIYELIEIVKLFRKSGLQFHLNVVGGGDLFLEIQDLIKMHQLSNTITLQGLVSNKNKLKELYDSSDAFIFTSHDEGFPRVLYEAMSSGLPIFTTFVGGISGRMKNRVNCIEIPVKSPVDASKIILKHINDSSLMREIGKGSLNTMKEIIDGDLLSHDKLLLKHIIDE